MKKVILKENGLSFPRSRASHTVHAFAAIASHHHLPDATTSCATITVAPDSADISAAAGLSKSWFIIGPPKDKIALLDFVVPAFKKQMARKIPPDSEQCLEVKSKHLHSLLTWIACPPGNASLAGKPSVPLIFFLRIIIIMNTYPVLFISWTRIKTCIILLIFTTTLR